MTNIIPLSEGTFTVGHDKVFHQFDEQNEEITDRATGSLLVEIQPFAVVNDRDVILLDTGLGFHGPDGKAHLVENLRKHHIHPEDVTKVLLSHLHKDHSGGINISLFPSATFYVYKKEFEYAKKIGFPSYYLDDLNQLAESNQVVWLEEESGHIDHYIHYKHTGGHSPEHIAFWIESEDGVIFYGGDEAPQLKQVKMKYVAKYDFDGKKAMELRKEWAEIGKNEKWKFLFYHDVNNSTAILK